MASRRERRLPPAPAFQMENPFSVKVLQVFTGAGVGCGVGIGVGRPIYLGNKNQTLPRAAVPFILRIIRMDIDRVRHESAGSAFCRTAEMGDETGHPVEQLVPCCRM